MIEIKGEDISILNDADLAELIGLLCEAELRSTTQSAVGVTYGGKQDEPDGGIDVRVDSKKKLPDMGFIPRPLTGFQVKKPVMARAAIIKEMRPNKKLRESIINLAKENGAYIIVSGKASCTDSMLEKRKEAMQEALVELGNNYDLHIDFYDQNRIASWVREHPSMIFWVREKIGAPILGWQPYKAWGSNSTIKETYLTDDLKIYKGPDYHNGLPIVEGINDIRKALSTSRQSIRIVGLSGVGKTRLLQALFDERIGTNALNKHKMIYGDVGDTLIPEPKYLAHWLVSLKQPLILAVDNCPPDLHRSLSDIYTKPDSLVNLVTIEYDIKEDQPEETKVFKLEPASEILIQKIIQYKFRFKNHYTVRKISEFSGGNFKIAIALAKTIQRGESIEHLKDNELFERLFFQRNSKSFSLLKSAEVCSLVYSFNSETLEGENDEMKFLSSLAGMSVNELYRDISELKRRDLIQSRGIWRAVLPHAIANRLASRALENIPLNQITTSISSSSERLLKSFSNRLSYLNHDKNAQKIAAYWLSKDGMLGNIQNLNSFGLVLLKRIAFLFPEATFNAIKRVANDSFLSNKNPQFKYFINLIKALAYYPEIFDESLDMLVEVYSNSEEADIQKYIRECMQPLFNIRHSRTHAPLQQRIVFIRKLFQKEEKLKQLGLVFLNELFTTRNFSRSSRDWDLNKKLPDVGYFPEQREREEIVLWYLTALLFYKELIESKEIPLDGIQHILVDDLRDLLTFEELIEQISILADVINKASFWIEGWLEIRSILRFHKEKFDVEIISKIEQLEQKLAPKNLLDETRAYAFSSDRGAAGLMGPKSSEETKEDWKALDEKTKELGQNVGSDYDSFKVLLQECVSKDFHWNRRGIYFGNGIAKGAQNPEILWKDLVTTLASTDPQKHNYTVSFGFIEELSKINPSLSDKLLNEAVSGTTLASIYPSLECYTVFSKNTFQRLKDSFKVGKAIISRYGNIGYAKYYNKFSVEELCEILNLLADKKGGIEIVVDILHTVLSDNESHLKGDALIKDFSQSFLLRLRFDRSEYRRGRSDLFDYRIENIVKFGLEGEKGKEVSLKLCQNLINAVSTSTTNLINFPKLLSGIATCQPLVFLNTFLSSEESATLLPEFDTDSSANRNPNPISVIDDQILIDWCKEKPNMRFKLLASFTSHHQNQNDQLTFTQLFLTILDEAPNKIDILRSLEKSFNPTFWSGSRATIIENRIPLLEKLKKHNNEEVSKWAIEYHEILLTEIKDIKERELLRNTYREQRFED